MTHEHTDEQLIRDWMTETVWLPDSDLSGVQARIHRTPQHRGLLPPLDPGGFVRMFSATKVFVAGIVLALIGGFFVLELLPGGGDPVGPGVAVPTTTPEDEPLGVALPSQEPAPTEPGIIAPTEPPTGQGLAAPAPGKIHWEDGGITFDANAVRIDAFGRRFEPTTLKWLENDYKGNRVDGLPPEAIIEAHWKDDGDAMRLRLDLRTDGDHWWIERAYTFGDVKEPGNPLSYPSLKDETMTKVGEPMKASIDTARPAKGIRLRIDGMRIDAFRPDLIPEYSPKPRSPRLNVSVESKTMLPGQHQRLTAEWCLEGECWPAGNVHWSTDDPDIVDFSPGSGSWTEVTALQPGRGSVAGRAKGQEDVHTFWVYPRPGGGDIPADMDPLSVAVAAPDEGSLKLGQHVILTSWRCPSATANQRGADGQPGTDDDGCEVEDAVGLRSIGESTLSLVEVVGPSALLRVDGFGGLDGKVAPSPVQVGFLDYRSVGDGEQQREISSARFGTSNLYVRDGHWRGALLGDLDEDGVVDAADRQALASVMETNGPGIGRGDSGWHGDLDLNDDRRIDDVDQGLLEALVRSHAGEAEGQPVTARGWWLEEPGANGSEAAEGSSSDTGVLTGFIAGEVRTAASAVRWSDGGVTFEARDFTIETNGLTFKPRKPLWTNGSHGPRVVKGVPKRASIESHWKDQGRPMRLWLRLESNGKDWWVDSTQTYDGTRQPSYLSYSGLKKRTLTPLGEAFEGALTAQATGGYRSGLVPGASVRFEGMRLEAFDVDAIPVRTPQPVHPTLNVTMANISPLPGQTVRAEAQWCLTETDCWPAEDVRWSTQSPAIVKVEPTAGSWTLLTARKAGFGSVEANAPGHGYAFGFNVRPRPGRIADYEQHDPRGFYLGTPREQVLKVGQYAVVTGWRCPTKGCDRLGHDREPGTDDDGCRTDELANVWVRDGTGLAHVGTTGPSAVVLADAYELDQDDVMATWVGLRFGTDAGGSATAAPYIYIRDAEWRGPLLGDLDDDGFVDDADIAIVSDALDEHGPQIARRADGWRKRLDLNGDYVIDAVDVDVLELLVGAHSGEITPVVPTPRPPIVPDVVEEPPQSPAPSPTPAPPVASST